MRYLDSKRRYTFYPAIIGRLVTLRAGDEKRKRFRGKTYSLWQLCCRRLNDRQGYSRKEKKRKSFCFFLLMEVSFYIVSCKFQSQTERDGFRIT